MGATPPKNPEAGIDAALADSARELSTALERHTNLLTTVLGSNALESRGRCTVPGCPCRRVLRRTLVETIAVLDDTRKSFKSRQLAVLRHKLIDVLGEQD